MDGEAGTLIRYAGVLTEYHHFVHVPAWETAWVFDRPSPGDGSYVVDLLDVMGKVVSRASPQIEFHPPEDPGGGGLWIANVLVYVPMHPAARVLLFRRMLPDELEIHRAELSPQPPMISDLVIEGDPLGDLHLSWATAHDRRVTFDVFFWLDGRSPLLLANSIEEPTFRIDGTKLPGPRGRFAVAASDGFRSSVVLGRPMDGFSDVLKIRITAPFGETVLPPDQPVDLAAQVEDASGTKTNVDGVTWWIDGEAVAEGRVSAVPAPEPGEHKIEATGVRGTIQLESDSVAITIAERSAAQRERRERLSNLPPLEQLRRETGW